MAGDTDIRDDLQLLTGNFGQWDESNINLSALYLFRTDSWNRKPKFYR